MSIHLTRGEQIVKCLYVHKTIYQFLKAPHFLLIYAFIIQTEHQKTHKNFTLYEQET